MAEQEGWQQKIRKLALMVADRKLSQLDIARATGVHQGQVSRILSGHSKRFSRNTKKLCQYADTIRPAVAEAPRAAYDLQQAILSVWNGTNEHAQALKQLLQAVHATQRSFRPSDE